MAEDVKREAVWPDEYKDLVGSLKYIMVGREGEPVSRLPKERVTEMISVLGEGVPTVKGGLTSATAVILAPGPIGANRKMEKVSGWYVNGAGNPLVATGTPWEAPAESDNTNWWNGSTWALSATIPMPKQDLTTVNEKISKLERDTVDANLMLKSSAEDLHIFTDNDGNAVAILDKNSKLKLQGLTKSVQDELVDLKNQPKLREEPLNDLYQFVDGDGNTVAKIDKDSNLILYGLEGNVQENISKLKEITNKLATNNADLIIAEDDEGNIIYRFDNDSKMYIAGLEKSVQDEIIPLKKGYALNSPISSSPYKRLTQKGRESLTTRLLYGLANFPIPHGTLPQDWIFPISEIPALRAPKTSEYVRIAMTNGRVYFVNSGVVHPNIFEFDFPINGYKYWMTINGYPNESWEICWLYGSNDPELKSWKLMPNCPQPFEDNPVLEPPYISSHDSDSFMTYNPLTGEMVVAWRRTMRWHPTDADKQTNEYRCRTSVNGVNWSDVKQLINPVTADIDLMQSMGIVFNPDTMLFYAFDVANTVQGWKMKWKSNKNIFDTNGWSAETYIEVPAGVKPWHLDVKYVGKTILILLHENQNVSPGQDRLWFCATDDLQNFTWSSSDILGGTTPLYKSTFIPVFNGDGTMKFRIAYTTDERAAPGEQWRLKITETQSFNIN